MPDKNAEFLPQGEDNEERELDTIHARQGVTSGGRVFLVLAIGLVLVVALFAIIYIAGP